MNPSKAKKSKEAKEISKSFTYRIIRFFYKFFTNFSRRLNKAAIELNYLLYQMQFGEREDDIYVVTFPKSGTTKMQMILYQMTTDGSMDFRHIDDVAPWLKNDAFERRGVKKLKSPRIIKSHDAYFNFDKETKGRFIYVFRDGKDVAVSKYHQDKNYLNENLKFGDFMKDFFKEKKYNYFVFNKLWFENKNNLPILYISYEEMKSNMDGVVEKIIKFCKFSEDKVNRQRVKERSSFDFMKKYQEKFGVVPPEKKVYNEFIRKGKSGGWKEYFTEQHKAEFDKQFQKYLAPVFKK